MGIDPSGYGVIDDYKYQMTQKSNQARSSNFYTEYYSNKAKQPEPEVREVHNTAEYYQYIYGKETPKVQYNDNGEVLVKNPFAEGPSYVTIEEYNCLRDGKYKEADQQEKISTEEMLEEYFSDYYFEYDPNSLLSKEEQVYEYIAQNADSEIMLKIIENLELDGFTLFGGVKYGMPLLYNYDDELDFMSNTKINMYMSTYAPLDYLPKLDSSDTYSIVLALTGVGLPYVEGYETIGYIDSALTIIEVCNDANKLSSVDNLESTNALLTTDGLEIGMYDILYVENEATYFGKEYTYHAVFFVGEAYPFNDTGDSGPAIPVIYAYSTTTISGVVNNPSSGYSAPVTYTSESNLTIDVVGMQDNGIED